MANVKDIAAAKGYGFLLSQMFGSEPEYEYHDNYVRVYYPVDRLVSVQMSIEKMSSASPGAVRVDWFPMVAPLAVKKAVPFAVGIFALGYLLAKVTK